MTSSGSNLVLACLSEGARNAVLSRATAVELPFGTQLYAANVMPRYGFFLLSGLASVVVTMPDSSSAEVAMIGQETMVGSMHLLGSTPMTTNCTMQLAGAGLRVPLAHVQQEFDQCEEFRRVLLQSVQESCAAIAQIAACNRLHTAEERLVRWLLMAQDKTGFDTLRFTQEYLAEMIATQRSTVTITASDLQKRGLLSYSRGTIQITNREGLESAACSCYQTIRRLQSGVSSERQNSSLGREAVNG